MVIGWAFFVNTQFPARLPLGQDAASAIHELQRLVNTGEVLLTNVVSHGILEYTTPAEVPVEGRQPVIENIRILESTNRYLREVTDFFAAPSGVNPQTAFGAQWVLTSDTPEMFGATRTFGPSDVDISAARGLRLVWQTEQVSLYQAVSRAPRAERVGPSANAAPRFAVGLSGCLALFGVVSLLIRRHAARAVRDKAR
jgi:hypothetical protein